MPLLRLSLAQVDPVVGDLAGNALMIRAAVASAADQGAQIVAVGEMALTGYPIEDLALRPSFQAAARAALVELARDLATDGHGAIACVVGSLGHPTHPDPIEQPYPRSANTAAILHDGRVVLEYAKHHLPNYGVFDEARVFIPGDRRANIQLVPADSSDPILVALAICEDLWQAGGPVTWAREDGAALLVAINASPYERNKDDTRLALCQRRATEAGCPIAYVNLVGGQDDLIFDGDSLVVAPDGRLLARAPQFEAGVTTVDIPVPAGTGNAAPHAPVPRLAPADEPLVRVPSSRSALATGATPARLDDVAEVYHALTLGLRDYVDKNGFPSVLIGLSGGIDSALVAALACDAIGATRVHGVAMPSRYSSDHSLSDAADLAARTGLSFRTVPIQPMVDAFLTAVPVHGLAEENLQARVRGITLMALSNEEGHLVLTTGNKSELSVGYSTLYGDTAGGFAPIKDVPKTLVWELARWRNAQAERTGAIAPIPANSIDKPPSAELRPDQRDTDSLPDYADLDAILEGYVAADRSGADLAAMGADHAVTERVLRLTDLAEYKRRQYPPGPKISARAFGRDRRLPITNRWRERIDP